MDAIAKTEVEAEKSDSPIPQVRNIGFSAWGLGFRERLERDIYIYIYIYIYVCIYIYIHPTFIQGKTGPATAAATFPTRLRRPFGRCSGASLLQGSEAASGLGLRVADD